MTPFLTLFAAKVLGVSGSLAGVVLGAYGAGGIIGVLLSGTLVDRYGGRTVLIYVLVGGGITAAMIPAAPNYAVVVLPASILGAQIESVQPANNSAVYDLVDSRWRRSAYERMNIAINIGFSVGPIVGGALSEISFGALFYIGGTLLVGSGCLVSLLIKPSERPPDTPARAGIKSQVSGLAVVFRDRVFLVFVLLNVVFMIIYMQSQATFPLALTREGFHPAHYGVLLTINGVVLIVLQVPVSSLLRRVKESRLLIVGMLLLGVGVGLQAVATSMLFYAFCVTIWSIGELFNMPVSVSVTSRLAPKGMIGRYMGVHSLGFSLATLFGPIVGGLLFDSFGATWLWVCCGVMAAVAAMARWRSALSIDKRLPA